MMKRGRTYLWSGAVIAAAAVLFWLAGYLYAYFFPSAPQVPASAVCTPVELQAGESAEAVLVVTLPVTETVITPEITGENIIAATLRATPVKWRWNRRVWMISGRFTVLKPGTVKGLKIEFQTRKIFSARANDKFSTALPELTVKLDENNLTEAELLLAGEITPPAPASRSFIHRFRYWLIAAGVMLIAGIAYWLWRKSRRKPELPAWEFTIAEIGKLRSEVAAGVLLPERGFARLCDLLRNYLEIRSQLPASRLTTAEFMAMLLADDSLPVESERNFLRRFLDTADLIKFACLRSNTAAFDQAALRAEEFIRTTIPEVTK